jgi:hypothetical protein
MSEVHGKVDVYRVVYTDDSGNHTALVFKEPVEGTVFKQGEMFALPGATECPGNDQGEIPQIETGEKGVSWSWQK